MKAKLLWFALIIISVSSVAQNHKQAWSMLNRNSLDSAENLLSGSIKKGSASFEDYLTYQLIKQFKGQENEITSFSTFLNKADNPYPYIYALWFTAPVIGDYGYKSPHQLDLIKKLTAENPGNGSLKAACYYSLGHHYVNTQKFPEADAENKKMGSILEWQFVGPFNNVSGSGFSKEHDAVAHHENDFQFTSKTNAKVKWFTPAVSCKDGWVFPGFFISASNNAIHFAQSFVNSPEEQDVIISCGGSGSMKVWVNGKLQITQQEERVTELDAYSSKCHLNKGYNRVVVQVGYSGDVNSANFIVRFTDNNYNFIPGLSATSQPQPYKAATDKTPAERLPFSPEVYFKERIQKDPSEVLNYIMLDQVYLRNKNVSEGRKTIEKALSMAPSNPLLNWELLQCYLKESNRTRISELVNWFKTNSPESVLSYTIRIQELENERKYQEALELTNKQIKVYGLDESTMNSKILLINSLKDYPLLYATIDSAVDMFPRSSKFAEYTFNIMKNAKKEPEKALKYLEKFLQTKYDYELTRTLIKEYFAQNQPKKAYQLLNRQTELFPYDASMKENLLSELYSNQKYEEAYACCNKMLALSPYSGRYWENKAIIENVLQKKDDAYNSYQTAISFQPTLYNAREKQRLLKGKKPLRESLPAFDIDQLIRDVKKSEGSEYNDFEYILDDQINVFYPEGGKETYSAVGIRILGQKGLEEFKETRINYNGDTESLLIEDAQLIKPSGKKIKPEINDNLIVWTGIQLNDILYIKFKRSYYLEGKLSREYFDHYSFNASVPVANVRYALIAPNDKPLQIEVRNGKIEPEITDVEGFRIYNWTLKDLAPSKDEPYMPPFSDIGLTLHLSTVKDWNEIGHYYSDLVYSKIQNDYAVVELAKTVIPEPGKLSAMQKAKMIYEYIGDNISYSSVAFRQAAMIPQKASTTIHTGLGDCKDLSTLFVSLADQCGLKANLVLIDTRNNGMQDMILPSFQFNHCIVQFIDEKGLVYNLELTDPDLPFLSLPDNLYNALSLTVPRKDETTKVVSLELLKTFTKTSNKASTSSTLFADGTNLILKSKVKLHGGVTSGLRNKYEDMSQEKAMKEFETALNKKFNTTVKLESVKFDDLVKRNDSITIDYSCQLVNHIQKIGNMYAIKIPFYYQIATRDPFANDKREYPFEYWKYEDTEKYLSDITIEIPAGRKFTTIPENVSYSCAAGKYNLTYKKVSENKILVKRTAELNRENISAADFPKFKEFMNGILDKENTFVVYQ